MVVLILHRLAIIGVGIGARLGIELARAKSGRATRLADHCLVGWRTSRARRVGPSNELTPRVGRAGAEFARQCNRLRPQARRDPLAAARRVGVADEGGAVVRPGMATVAHPWRYEFLATAAGPRARAPPPTSRRRVVGRPVLTRALDLLKVKLNGPDEAITAAAGLGASETACSVVISQPVPARARILLLPCDIVADRREISRRWRSVGRAGGARMRQQTRSQWLHTHTAHSLCSRKSRAASLPPSRPSHTSSVTSPRKARSSAFAAAEAADAACCQ